MNVLLLDDHPLFRKGIAQVLIDLGVASKLFESTLAEEALFLLEEQPDIDCIFLDLQLPDMDGLDFLVELSKRQFSTPVLVLSGNTEPACIDYALQAGASAYLDKSTLGDEIAEAVEVIKQGGCYVARSLRRSLDNYRADPANGVQPIVHLTHRQQQILQCLCDGYSNQKIAEILRITESTVKGHVSTLFTIFDVDNRTQCLNAAKRHHILNNQAN